MKSDLHVPLVIWLAIGEPIVLGESWVDSQLPETPITTNGIRNSASDISSQAPS